ncbi:MAG TPA: NADH:flavin oxidoreductase [Armatimonadota bacterium]
MSRDPYPKIGGFRDVQAFKAHLRHLGLLDEEGGGVLPCDDGILTAPESPLARPLEVHGRRIGNRFTVQPMEGWDGTLEGMPSENTLRRWRHFGLSGAKLIWGGEAVAVRPDARANPNQLLIREETLGGLEQLREALLSTHREHHGTTDDLLLGLQLTHSGRFSRPTLGQGLQPRILYLHPLLDRRFGLPEDYPVLTDGEIEEIIADFVLAAVRARKLGFDFIDLKHCHGYLGHEFLSAVDRPGPYGGSLENRTRFLREVVAGVRAEAPGLLIGVRVSLFDLLPFHPRPSEESDAARDRPRKLGPGVPDDWEGRYPYAFGADPSHPTWPDLTEAFQFLQVLRDLGIRLLNVTAGSPYYNPHIQRPALYPPSDGYQPPEDPLLGVARQVAATAEAKRRFPEMLVVGTAYSYLQEYLPHVAQALVRRGDVDSVGLGRMVLSYPELPTDVLSTGRLQKKRLCRTFSDCTTAPRKGLPSGCYPLDPHYKRSADAETLKAGRRVVRA